MSMTKTSKALGVLAVFVLASGTAWASTRDSGVSAPPADPSTCASAEIATLSVVDCAGIEPVASLADQAGTDSGPGEASLAAGLTPAATDAASAASMTPAASGLPSYCRLHLQAVFYAATDWLRLGQ